VTVALSGDGGDEVFGGYNRYAYGTELLPRIVSVPSPARRLIASGIGMFSSDSLARVHRTMTPVLPRALQHRLAGEKLSKLGTLMAQPGVALMSSAVDRVLSADWPANLSGRMMLADQLGYLPDDQLAKIDRVSMAVSLEVRVPLLDHRVVEFAARLPTRLKIANGKGKCLLRRVLYRRVPESLVERPKVGFTVPLAQWLRGSLRDWAEDLLQTSRLEHNGILNAAPVHRAWKQLIGGHSEVALSLWSVLVLQSWRQRYLA
jgi:asparagine synthase (glutamine-hydrolysing)